MRLHTHRRELTVFSSSARPSDSYRASRYKRPARLARIRRLIRIAVLLTVIAVQPRWRPLLAGTILTVFGLIERQGTVGLITIPGMLFLWYALLTPGDADRERRAELKRELAAYSTPSQRCDLEATLNRYPDEVTYEIRHILASQAVASPNSGIPGAGWRSAG
jgi:hypothetical protein